MAVKDCPVCKGSTNCQRCYGKGKTGIFGDIKCNKCGGSGNCARCHGKGVVPK
jgi:hypothetical protein